MLHSLKEKTDYFLLTLKPSVSHYYLCKMLTIYWLSITCFSLFELHHILIQLLLETHKCTGTSLVKMDDGPFSGQTVGSLSHCQLWHMCLIQCVYVCVHARVSTVDLAICRNPVTFSRAMPIGTHTFQSHCAIHPLSLKNYTPFQVVIRIMQSLAAPF